MVKQSRILPHELCVNTTAHSTIHTSVPANTCVSVIIIPPLTATYLPEWSRARSPESAKRTAQKADFQWIISVVNSSAQNGSSVIKKSCANFFDLEKHGAMVILDCVGNLQRGEPASRQIGIQ